MFPSSMFLGLALLPFVSAVVHDIQVGADGLSYSPEAIAAQPGDQVVFHFVNKNHTATQSSFADPCGLKAGGFDSGFMPVMPNQTENLPTFTIPVNDNQPIWFYCRQKQPISHCGAGMVFAVNCGQDGSPNSFTNFKKAALAFGAAQSSALPSVTPDASAAAPGASVSASAPADVDATGWTTAAYGGYTIPAAPEATPVTQAVTLGDQVWTTTYDSVPGSPDPTPVSAGGAVHIVKVGGPGVLAFNPSSIQAQPRDIVVFEFLQTNHSVTQSSFQDPCRRLNANGTLGFDSGFMPVGTNVTDSPTWNYTVTDTAPVWGYCRQTNPKSHCGAGMVFAINAVETSERNFTAFQNLAEAMNGTAAAANAPAPSTTASSAASVRLGGAAVTVAFSLVLGLLL